MQKHLIDQSKLKEEITSRMEKNLDEQKIIGAVAAVYCEDEPLFVGAFGKRRVDDEQPMTTDTVFRMASMTKPITACAVGIAAGRGLLSLDDEVRRYLPEYGNLPIITERDGVLVNEGPAKTPITVRDCLTHSTGIGSSEYFHRQLLEMTPSQRTTLDGAVAYYASAGCAFEPRTREQYSSYAAFDIAARIVELVTDRSYEEFLQTELFEPLGMTDTSFRIDDADERLAGMHDRVNDKNAVGKTWSGCVFEDIVPTRFVAGAGLLSTLEDYRRFSAMLLNEGTYHGEKVVEPWYIREMKTAQVSPSVMPGPIQWGLGVRVITGEEYGNLPVGSFGWSGAYGTHFWVDPVNRVTAIYLKNSRYDGGVGMTAMEFEQAVHASFIDK